MPQILKEAESKVEKVMGEVSAVVPRVCATASPHLVTKACTLIGREPTFPAISLAKGRDKSVGTRKTNKLQMWSEVQSVKDHCVALNNSV